MTFLAEVDVEALGELELEGLIEPDDHSHVPDIALEDYMVTIKLPESVTVPGTNTAGFNPAAIAKALVRFFKGGPAGGAAAQRPPIPIQPGARLFGGANKGEGTGSSRFAALRKGATNIIHKRARPEAKSAAGKSQAVQNILKSKTFQECLAIGAGVALGQVATKREEARNKYTTEYGSKHILEIDLDAQKKNNYPAPEDNETTILMVMDANTDAGEDEDPDGYLSTYQDNYNREDRLRYEGCGSVLYSNEVTLLQTWNGCCKYYDGDNCEPETGVFKQTDREDGELRGKNNDAVSSYWCNFDRNCTGAPGG
jgi:hypothetical protein